MLFAKIISLAVAITYTYSNTAKLIKNQKVHSINVHAMGVSLAIFICLMLDN